MSNPSIIAPEVQEDGETDIVAALVQPGFAPGDFETPFVGFGNFRYNPIASPWVFVGPSGISGNSSAFTSGNPNAPQGGQVGIIQNTGYAYQAHFRIPTAGYYGVTFLAARRGNWGGQQQIGVQLSGNGSSISGAFTPFSTSYTQFSTGVAYFPSGNEYTLTIYGINGNGDNTAFVDGLNIFKV